MISQTPGNNTKGTDPQINYLWANHRRILSGLHLQPNERVPLVLVNKTAILGPLVHINMDKT